MFEPYDYSRLAKGASPTAPAMRRYYTASIGRLWGGPAGNDSTGNGAEGTSVAGATRCKTG